MNKEQAIHPQPGQEATKRLYLASAMELKRSAREKAQIEFNQFKNKGDTDNWFSHAKKLLKEERSMMNKKHNRSLGGLVGYLRRKGELNENHIQDGKYDIESLKENTIFTQHPEYLDALKNYTISKKAERKRKALNEPKKAEQAAPITPIFAQEDPCVNHIEYNQKNPRHQRYLEAIEEYPESTNNNKAPIESTKDNHINNQPEEEPQAKESLYQRFKNLFKVKKEPDEDAKKLKKNKNRTKILTGVAAAALLGAGIQGYNIYKKSDTEAPPHDNPTTESIAQSPEVKKETPPAASASRNGQQETLNNEEASKKQKLEDNKLAMIQRAEELAKIEKARQQMQKGSQKKNDEYHDYNLNLNSLEKQNLYNDIAKGYLDDGLYRSTILRSVRVLSLNPNNKTAKSNIDEARTKLKERNDQLANPETLSKTSAEDLINKSYSQMARGEYHKSIKVLHDALKIDPGNPYMQSLIGVAWSGIGEHDKAIEAINKGLGKQLGTEIPDEKALTMTAIDLLNLGDIPASLEAIQKALDINPNNPDAKKTREIALGRMKYNLQQNSIRH